MDWPLREVRADALDAIIPIIAFVVWIVSSLAKASQRRKVDGSEPSPAGDPMREKQGESDTAEELRRFLEQISGQQPPAPRPPAQPPQPPRAAPSAPRPGSQPARAPGEWPTARPQPPRRPPHAAPPRHAQTHAPAQPRPAQAPTKRPVAAARAAPVVKQAAYELRDAARRARAEAAAARISQRYEAVTAPSMVMPERMFVHADSSRLDQTDDKSPAEGIAAYLEDLTAVRRAVVLRELLAAPLALRRDTPGSPLHMPPY